MVETLPRQKVYGVVKATLKAGGRDFVSEGVDSLELSYDGIKGDFHHGLTRASGAREPWYQRGTMMRNERQISAVAEDELAQVAKIMDINKIEPGWIGANLVIEGIKNLSLLPSRTLLIFEGGVTLRVDGANGPCRFAGGSIATHLNALDGNKDKQFEDENIDLTKSELALAFVPAAKLKRGLVLWVEREGVIEPGEKMVGHVWEQWLYR